jgi:hypothetical protein
MSQKGMLRADKFGPAFGLLQSDGASPVELREPQGGAAVYSAVGNRRVNLEQLQDEFG